MKIIAAFLGGQKNIYVVSLFIADADGGLCSNCKIHIDQGALGTAQGGRQVIYFQLGLNPIL